MALTTIGNTGAQGTAALPAAPQAVAPKVAVALPEPPPQQQSQPDQVQKAVGSLKQIVESKAPNSLSFSIDDTTGKTIVTITDAQTGETIRQIPSEEVLDIARSLDKLQGMLLRQEV